VARRLHTDARAAWRLKVLVEIVPRARLQWAFLDTWQFRITLVQVLRIADSALKRGYSREDISYAYDTYIYEGVIDPDWEPVKILTIGFHPNGFPLELIAENGRMVTISSGTQCRAETISNPAPGRREVSMENDEQTDEMKGGRVLTNRELEALADEAERGYDPVRSRAAPAAQEWVRPLRTRCPFVCIPNCTQRSSAELRSSAPRLVSSCVTR